MRFSYAEAMCDPSFYLPLAIAAEEAGYHSFVVPDNLGYLGPSEAKYPYMEGFRQEHLDAPDVRQVFKHLQAGTKAPGKPVDGQLDLLIPAT